MTHRYYALACDELPDRRDALLAHLAGHGIRPRLIRGIHGKTWGLDTTLEYEPGKRISAGHVALNLGSWVMWATAHAESNLKTVDPLAPCIFFEDDAVLADRWDAELARVHAELDEANHDWDLVFLGLAESEPHVWNKVTERLGRPDSPICRLSDPFGTHALMVRPRALPVLLEHMREARRNLDQQLWRNVLKPGRLNWCAVLPTLVRQRTFDYTGGARPEWGPSCVDAAPISLAEVDAPGRPSAETYRATLDLVDPYPCIYRGEPLNEHGRAVNVRKSVAVNECARLNVPCHARPDIGPVTHELGPAAVCQTCELRADMRPADRRRDRLPLPDGHFNPSLAMYRGRLILATRDSWGHSKVGLWQLDNAAADWTGEWRVRPLASLGSPHPEATRLEDPRLFVGPGWDGESRLLCAFNLPDGYPPKVVQVGYALFSGDLTRIEDTHVFRSPRGSVYEKNWEPFYDGHDLNWVYAGKPEHMILDADGCPRWATPNPLPWTGGVVRGGCPPVLAEVDPAAGTWVPGAGRGEYYAFFHGCLKRTFGNVYTVGCYTFEPRPPYRITRMTPTPLVWPDLPAADEDVVKRFVVFPGGAVPHAGAWHLACGVDDSFCRIVRLPFAAVEAALKSAPEAAGAVHSLRDTPVALGVRPE